MNFKNSTTTTAYQNFNGEVKKIKKAFLIINTDGFGTQDDVAIFTDKARKLLEQQDCKYLNNLIVRLEKIGRTI